MKKRLGFVSNSSSTSYVCEICGEEVSGMDCRLSEAEMIVCENDHTICDHHIPDALKIIPVELLRKVYEKSCEAVDQKHNQDALVIEMIEGIQYNYTNDREDVPSECCPICQFTTLTDGDFVRYISKSRGITIEKILAEIKSKYFSYRSFDDYIKKEG